MILYSHAYLCEENVESFSYSLSKQCVLKYHLPGRRNMFIKNSYSCLYLGIPKEDINIERVGTLHKKDESENFIGVGYTSVIFSLVIFIRAKFLLIRIYVSYSKMKKKNHSHVQQKTPWSQNQRWPPFLVSECYR